LPCNKQGVDGRNVPAAIASLPAGNNQTLHQPVLNVTQYNSTMDTNSPVWWKVLRECILIWNCFEVSVIL